MDILVVLGHPRPGSLNHAIADVVLATLREAGHRTTFHDLCREGFDPALPAEEMLEPGPVPEIVVRHCQELAAADGIVVVHPNWWGQPPAVLKGWVDRVFRPAVAYRFEGEDGGEGVPVGLLRARRALVLNTSNTAALREQETFGDPLDRIWRHCIFGLCGVREVHRRTFGIVVASTPEQRRAWLQEAREVVQGYFPAESCLPEGA